MFYAVQDDGFGRQVWRRYESVLRARHQEQGMILTTKILQNLNYSDEQISEIAEIISQHDTRKGFISKNEGIMRDADKLWRSTLPHFNVWLKKRKSSFENTLNYFNKSFKREGFFYSEISKDIAKIELENTFNNYIKLS